MRMKDVAPGTRVFIREQMDNEVRETHYLRLWRRSDALSVQCQSGTPANAPIFAG